MNNHWHELTFEKNKWNMNANVNELIVCTRIERERVQLLSELSNHGYLGIIKSVSSARFSNSKTLIVELEYRSKRQCPLNSNTNTK